MTKVSVQTLARGCKNVFSWQKPYLDFLILLTENILHWFWSWRFLMNCTSKFCYRYGDFQNTEAVTGSVLKSFTKFRGKHLCQSLFFNKVAVIKLQTSALPSPATLLKKAKLECKKCKKLIGFENILISKISFCLFSII